MPMNSRFDLEGRVVIVTGGGKGIGKVYAQEFARAGAKVVAADIDGAAAEAIASAIHKYRLQAETPRLRILEVGAYRHHAGYKLADSIGAEVVLSDIAARALEDGCKVAHEAGLSASPTLVAADFHDLPFVDGYFDLVFVASSVHHTRRPEVMLDELFRRLDGQLRHDALARRGDRVLHLHRLEDAQDVARLDALPRFHEDADDRPLHRRGDDAVHALAVVARVAHRDRKSVV